MYFNMYKLESLLELNLNILSGRQDSLGFSNFGNNFEYGLLVELGGMNLIQGSVIFHVYRVSTVIQFLFHDLGRAIELNSNYVGRLGCRLALPASEFRRASCRELVGRGGGTGILACWKTAEGPLAAALKDDLAKSVTLGFKMIIRLLGFLLISEKNFEILLDINDRFLISINPPTSVQAGVIQDRQAEDNTKWSWDVLNVLCQKVLRSANRVLHMPSSSLVSPGSPEQRHSTSEDSEQLIVSPRREFGER
ncbi:hypothetical protein B0H11DRAFT_1915953 [Mycena galericulata]|nr:hypothetical protein B0H11DRAFT_1915951 [Mycena galericulata]KAJ7480206.1 hypothetical protein B0H11DRAFT_1915953 [Mycena galericulata]